MSRCHNSCEIIDFEDPIIAHHLHTEQGSSGSPILIADEKGVLSVCGLHLGYHSESSPLFNKALYVHSMYQHLTGKQPSCTINAAIAKIRYRTDVPMHENPEEDLESLMRRFTSKNTVIISKVPEQVSDHYMLLYLNSICDRKDPVLRRKGSQILALFDCDCSGEVVQKLTEQSSRIPLEIPNGQKCYIEAYQLTPPDGVHVRNISERSHSALENIESYFNNEGRSGGKGVKSMTIGPNKSRIVVFKDPTSVNKVMLKEHKSHFGDSVEIDLFSSVLTYWTTHSPWQVETVWKGIVDCDTDVYINSPPDTLCLNFGGLARSMLKAGGKEFADACEEYKKQHGKVKAGDIAVTGGGRMKCRYVIHAVGTEYPKDKNKAKEVMSKLVNKVLEECKYLEVSTVAIPALGTGNLHYPPRVSAEAIVKTVNTYLYSNACSSLKKVVLVANDENMYKEFKNHLNWL